VHEAIPSARQVWQVANSRIKAEVEITLYEGWADRIGMHSAHLSRLYVFDRVPVKGEYVDTNQGEHQVNTVFWKLDGSAILRLEKAHSLSEPFDEVLADYKRSGWDD
jgi:hypothetical protein